MNNIIAQIFGGLATLSNTIGIQFKTKKEILISYVIACLFFIISFYLLDAYSGVATCFIMGIETIINYLFDKNNKIVPKWLIVTMIIVSVGIASLFYKSPFDLLSITSCIPFVLMITQKKEQNVRIFTLIFLLFYMTYDLFVLAYTAFIGDAIFATSTIISLIRYNIIKKN